MNKYVLLQIVIVQLLYFSSCQKSTEPIINSTAPDTTSHDFSWQFDTLAYPRSDQTLIDGLWGSSENDVYAVGHNDRAVGQIWHWNGMEWKSLVNDSGPIDPYYIRGGSFNQVFGTSENDVWIVGGNVRGKYPDFIRQELILHYNGAEWIKKEFDGFTVLSVWGVSAEDIWFGTADGELIHYNGANWEVHDLGFKAQINSMSGFSSSEIYAHAIGSDNQAPDDSLFLYFLKYDGSDWMVLDQYLYTDSQTEEIFGGYLWGNLATQQLYSSGGRVYLWNGEEWSIINEQARGMIYGSSYKNIFVVSDKVYHYNGNTWKRLESLPKLNWASVWCNENSVFISSIFFDSAQKSLIIRGIQKN